MWIHQAHPVLVEGLSPRLRSGLRCIKQEVFAAQEDAWSLHPVQQLQTLLNTINFLFKRPTSLHSRCTINFPSLREHAPQHHDHCPGGDLRLRSSQQ